MKEFIAITVRLSEPCKRSEGMTLSVTGMTAAAGVGDKYRTKAIFRCEYVVVESNVALEELFGFFSGQPFHRPVKQLVVLRGGGHDLLAGANDDQNAYEH